MRLRFEDGVENVHRSLVEVVGNRLTLCRCVGLESDLVAPVELRSGGHFRFAGETTFLEFLLLAGRSLLPAEDVLTAVRREDSHPIFEVGQGILSSEIVLVQSDDDRRLLFTLNPCLGMGRVHHGAREHSDDQPTPTHRWRHAAR
jgi:hypothetical protein